MPELVRTERRKRHIHKYGRVNIAKKDRPKYEVYRCFDGLNCPKPTHYLPPELIVGHPTKCWKCDNVVTMTKDMATKKKPICTKCRGVVGTVNEEDFDAVVEKMMAGEMTNILDDDE